MNTNEQKAFNAKTAKERGEGKIIDGKIMGNEEGEPLICADPRGPNFIRARNIEPERKSFNAEGRRDAEERIKSMNGRGMGFCSASGEFEEGDHVGFEVADG